MSETKLADVIVPEVFTGYTFEPSIYKSRFFNSGALVRNPAMDGLLAGGGSIMNRPFWGDISGASGDIPSETAATSVNALSAKKEAFRRHFREKAWGSNDIAKVFAGADPLQGLIDAVAGFWGQAFDQVAIASVRGAVAKDLSLTTPVISKDISGETGAAANFSDSAVIDAQALLGENGTVGRDDQNGGDFSAILVHPAVYASMRKLDLIDFVPVSGQERPLPFYMGMVVIVDRNAPVPSAGVYHTYLFKAGALEFGQSMVGYQPTEPFRDPSKGGGIDILYSRRVFGIHPVGMQWADASVAGVSPTDAELYAATGWTQVFKAENMKFVALIHKIG